MANQDFRILFPDVVPDSLSAEYISFELWVKSRLGDDFAAVELSPKQIWWALQEADMEFSAEMHTAYLRNNMSHFFGLSPNQNVAGIKPNMTFSYLSHAAKGLSDLAGIGGNNRDFIGYFTTIPGTQHYWLPEHLKDKDGNAVDFSNGVEIKELYYNNLATTSRYIDTWSYYNIMAGEFGVQSALYNTMFAMLPINANVMMMQHVKFNNNLRLSNYSWEMYGDNEIRIMPDPRVAYRVYTRYRHTQPIDNSISVTGSADGSSSTSDNTYVGNFSQVKLNPLEWNNLNQIAKRWIRKFGLALCKEILAFNRGKFQQIPFASENNSVNLNYDLFASQGKEEQSQLREQLRGDLEKMMDVQAIAERDAATLRAQREQWEHVPLFPYWIK